jgi:hypothetical protein
VFYPTGQVSHLVKRTSCWPRGYPLDQEGNLVGRASCQLRFLAGGWDVSYLASDILGSPGLDVCWRWSGCLLAAKRWQWWSLKPLACEKITIALKVQPPIFRIHLMSALCHPISISLFPKKDSWPTDCFWVSKQFIYSLVTGNFFSSSISRRTSWYWPRRVIYTASIWQCLYLQGRKYPTHKVYKFLVRRYYHHTSALSSKYPANLN